MSCRLFMIKLRRRGLLVVICGLLCCIIIVILLSLCNSPADSLEGHREGVEKEHHDLPQQDGHLIQTNLIIVVISAPRNSESRNVIRQTWASTLPEGVTVKFVMGTLSLPASDVSSIRKENNTFNDLLVLSDFKDSYNTLTLKLLATFLWVNKNVNYNFLMKVDEDSFVRVDRIMQELLKQPQERLYWGFFDGRAHVKKLGKWQEKDFVLCDRYLPYALGGGYILSSDLVDYISVNSKYFTVFKSEDVSIGTWLGPLNIHRIHDPRFDTEYKSRGCFNIYIVTHKKTSEDMIQLHQNLQTTGKLCPEEKRVRLSYQYNWDKLPTQCCERIDPSIP